MRIGFMMPHDGHRIAFAREHGFGCAELQVSPKDAFWPDRKDWKARADAVAEDFAGSGLRISCLAGFYGANTLAADRAAAREAADVVRAIVRLAEQMGVGTVAGFAGRVMGEPLEASIRPFQKAWAPLAKFAEDHGVKVAFENCPMGAWHLPPGGNNAMCTPDMWDACFDAVPSPALGLEWDPSHLVGLFIDPIQNLRRYGPKVHHVHAKDAKVYPWILRDRGITGAGAVEHCMPGFGDTDFAQVVKELRRAGYDGDLNIEGWHDAVFRDARPNRPGGRPGGEDEGLLLALQYLRPLVDGR